MSAHAYLKTLPHVDPERVGMMGWSHGGYITLLSIFRDQHPFKAGAAIVPVTNLIFRLSYKGPSYQRQFSTQKEVLGLPFEKRDRPSDAPSRALARPENRHELLEPRPSDALEGPVAESLTDELSAGVERRDGYGFTEVLVRPVGESLA